MSCESALKLFSGFMYKFIHLMGSFSTFETIWTAANIQIVWTTCKYSSCKCWLLSRHYVVSFFPKTSPIKFRAKAQIQSIRFKAHFLSFRSQATTIDEWIHFPCFFHHSSKKKSVHYSVNSLICSYPLLLLLKAIKTDKTDQKSRWNQKCNLKWTDINCTRTIHQVGLTPFTSCLVSKLYMCL